MIQFCIYHNGICYNEQDWHHTEENIEMILRREQKPAMMTKCPKCLQDSEKVQRVKKFLAMDCGRRK